MSVSLLKEYVEKIGDEVEVEENPADEVTILICTHGSYTYIISDDKQEFSTISYKYDILTNIAENLDSEVIEKITGEEPERRVHAADTSLQMVKERIEEDEEKIAEDDIEYIISNKDEDDPLGIEAAKSLLQSTDDDVMERFKFNLFQELSDPQIATNFDLLEDESFRGFQISRKVFPDDDGFSLTEFNKSVRAVLSVGVFGRNAVNTGLLPEVTNEKNTE